MDRHPADGHFATFRRTGEPKALAEVFDRLAPELLLVAAHLARSDSEPEDLLQATFLTAIESAERWDEARPLLPWLLGILINLARHEHRRRRHAALVESLSADSEPDPAAMLETAELAAQLGAALERLPLSYRHVMTLRWVHGLNPTEIAHSLGSPPATVKTQLRRGLSILRQALPAGIATAALLRATPGQGLEGVRVAVLAAAANGPPGAAAGAHGGAVVTSAARWLALPHRLLGELVVAGVLAAGAVLAWPEAAADLGPGPPPRDVALAADSSLPAPVQSVAARAPIDAPLAIGGTVSLDVHFAGDGARAGGAFVGFLPLDGDRPSLRERWVRADEHGRAHVANLVPGRYAAVAERGGRIELRVENASPLHATLAIPPGIDVDGEVVDGNGRALAGAAVHVSRPGALDEVVLAAFTDADGCFRLRAVEPQRCLSASATGFAISVHVPVVAPPHAGARSLRIALTDPGITIAGEVRDEAGRPIASACFMLGLNFPDPSTTVGHAPTHAPPLWLVSGADGRFSGIGAPRLRQPLWCAAPGYATHAQSLTPDGQPIHVVLRRGATLSGRTLDAAGSAVAGARVEVLPKRHAGRGVRIGPPWATLTATTGADGGFAVKGIASGAANVRVVDAAGRSAAGVLDLADGADHAWTAVLAVPAPIVARVVDAQGVPQPGASVALARAGENAARQRASTDAAGRAVFADVEPDTYSVSLVAATGPFAGALATVTGVRPGAEVELVASDEARLAGSIRGRVADAAGQPIPGVTVLAQLGVRGRAEATSASDGTFHLRPIPAAVYEVGVVCEDLLLARVSGVDAGAAGAPLDLIVHERGVVTFALAPASAALATKAAVRVVDEDGRCWAIGSDLTSGVENRFELPWGAYLAVVADPACALCVVPFAIRAGETTAIVVELTPGHAQVVRISHPYDGSGIELHWTWRDGDGRLLFRDRKPWYLSAAGDAEHRIGLAAGRYQLHLESDRGLAAHAAFTVTGTDRDVPVVLAMRAAPPRVDPPTDPRR